MVKPNFGTPVAMENNISYATRKSLTSPDLAEVSSNTRNGRLRVACQRCVKAKVRCDSRRPCSRCERQHRQDKCFDRPIRGEAGKNKYHRLRNGFRPCLPCIQRKIKCDSSRPCSRCRERRCSTQCIDRAVVVNPESTFMNVVLKFESPVQKLTQVPRELKSVWQNGFRRFSPSMIHHFLESCRPQGFHGIASLHMSTDESNALMNQLEYFASSYSAEGQNNFEDDSEFHLCQVSNSVILPMESTVPLLYIGHTYTPFGGLVVSCHMNGPAQALWGYSDEEIQSAFHKAYSDGIEHKQFKNVAFIWRLFHTSCWPSIAQLLLEVWFSGDGVYAAPLCAVRSDCKVIHIQTRWYMKFGNPGLDSVIIAKPL